MRISDWSSDVCSSDLRRIDRPFAAAGRLALQPLGRRDEAARRIGRDAPHLGRHPARDLFLKIGRSPGHEDGEQQPAEQQPGPRSEEHTSELQSLMRISYAVFCLQYTKIYTKHNTTNIIAINTCYSIVEITIYK